MRGVLRAQAAIQILDKTREFIYYSVRVPMLDQDCGIPSLYLWQSKQPVWTLDANPAPQLLSCICILLSCDRVVRERGLRAESKAPINRVLCGVSQTSASKLVCHCHAAEEFLTYLMKQNCVQAVVMAYFLLRETVLHEAGWL